MNPCKEISALSVHRQLDSIAEQVTAELRQYQNGGRGEEEAKSSPVSDDSKADTSKSPTSAEEDQSNDTCTKDHDCINTTAAGHRETPSGLQLPTEVEPKANKSSPANDDSEKMDTSRSKGDQSTEHHDRFNTTAGDGGESTVRILSGGLQLPVEVVLDGINTVLYSRLRFSAPSMQQYYNLENSFIDKVWEWDHVLRMLNMQKDMYGNGTSFCNAMKMLN
jgi:hypothetical protein